MIINIRQMKKTKEIITTVQKAQINKKWFNITVKIMFLTNKWLSNQQKQVYQKNQKTNLNNKMTLVKINS